MKAASRLYVPPFAQGSGWWGPLSRHCTLDSPRHREPMPMKTRESIRVLVQAIYTLGETLAFSPKGEPTET